MINGYLVDANATAVAIVYWMSKGSYDNEAEIHLLKDLRKVDTNVCRLNDCSEYVMIYETTHDKYVDQLNRYRSAYRAGLPQNELDDIYRVLCRMEQDIPESERHPHERLVQVSDRGMIPQTIEAITITASKIPYKERDLFVKGPPGRMVSVV